MPSKNTARAKHVTIKHEKAPDETLFNKQYKLIKEMRNGGVAANAVVDVLSENRPKKDFTGLSEEDIEEFKKTSRYQSLIGLMLSAQTKDSITDAALTKLRKHGCTVEEILATSKDDLEKLIYPVGFYKRKADFILRTSKILKDKYNGDIPRTVEQMIELPGVGPKMAYLCMVSAWNDVVGIGVDTHVHRISNRLKWVDTKTPEQTRLALEAFVPKEEWSVINKMLVGFGQTICAPIGPKCSKCSLSLEEDLCPYFKEHQGKSPKKAKKRKIKKEEESEDEAEEDSGGEVEMEDMFETPKRITRSASKVTP
jgi:endonuclease-3